MNRRLATGFRRRCCTIGIAVIRAPTGLTSSLKTRSSSYLRNFRRNYLVDEMFDFDYIDGLLRSWPARGTPYLSSLVTYRNDLLNALALADYIDLHFPN